MPGQIAIDIQSWCRSWAGAPGAPASREWLEAFHRLAGPQCSSPSDITSADVAPTVLRTLALTRLFASCDPLVAPPPDSVAVRPLIDPVPVTSPDPLVPCESLIAKALGEEAWREAEGQLRTLCRSARWFCEDQRQLDDLHPVAAWYQRMVAAEDPHDRRARGVYYTPHSVVAFIVRIAKQLLVEQFSGSTNRGSREGSPPPGVQVIDPACGCGLFLLETLRQCDSASLATSLVGYDISFESCLLTDWFLRSRSRNYQRSGSFTVRQVNPLEQEVSHLLGETTAESEIPVILGNPPYHNFGQANQGRPIRALLETYKQGLDEKKHNLDDDFIKFIRWGQHVVETRGSGILAFVTSSTYLRALTHRVMRESLLSSFDSLSIVDLGGSHGGHAPPAHEGPDENIFGIRSGVAIAFYVKQSTRGSAAPHDTVRYWQLRGTRPEKLAALDATGDLHRIPWETLQPASPHFPLAPVHVASSTYTSWPRIVDWFPQFISGVQTKNDKRFVDHDRRELAARMRQWFTEQHAAGKHLDFRFRQDAIRPYQVAPFDRRWIYYEPRLLGRSRYSIMKHLLSDGRDSSATLATAATNQATNQAANRALVFMRQSTNGGSYDHFLVTQHLVSDRVFYSRHGAPFVAPLWLEEREGRIANLSEDVLRPLRSWFSDWTDADRATCLFAYLYGVVQSPAYRDLFQAELRSDYPRIPVPHSGERLLRIAKQGARLARVHCSQPQRNRPVLVPGTSATEFKTWTVGAGYPRYDAESGRVYFNADRWCAAVPPEVWNAAIGGYKVLPRWLKQRRGREWTPEVAAQFAHLLQVLRVTGKLRQQLLAPRFRLQ